VPRVSRTKEPPFGFALLPYLRGEKIATVEEISAWKERDRAAVCGINGLTGFDFDSIQAFERFWDSNLRQQLANDTFVVKTSRGISVWFFDRSLDLDSYPSVIDCRPHLELEIFLRNHLLPVPFNVHPDGTIYKLLGTSQILCKPGIVKVAIERLHSLHIEVVNRSSNSAAPVGSLSAGILRLDPKFAHEVEQIIPELWTKGRRYVIQIALAGWFLRLGISRNVSMNFIIQLGQRLALEKEGEHWSRRIQEREIQAAYGSVSRGARIYGLSKLVEIAENEKRPEISRKLLRLNRAFRVGE